MSSGKVYFWNIDTNEVAWDPPEGSEPRSAEENAATLAQSRGEVVSPIGTEERPVSPDLQAGGVENIGKSAEEAEGQCVPDGNENAAEVHMEEGQAPLQQVFGH